MWFEVWSYEFGDWVLRFGDLGFWVKGLRSGALGSELKILRFGLGVLGLRFGVTCKVCNWGMALNFGGECFVVYNLGFWFWVEG